MHLAPGLCRNQLFAEHTRVCLCADETLHVFLCSFKGWKKEEKVILCTDKNKSKAKSEIEGPNILETDVKLFLASYINCGLKRKCFFFFVLVVVYVFTHKGGF